MLDYIMQRVIILPGILVGLCFHEFAHAFVSWKLGDNLPKFQGRVTVNPAAHIDAVGFIALLLLGFGWGKPVQIDPRNYKHRRIDELLVSLAGVVMNFLIALAGVAVMRLIYQLAPGFITGELGGVVWSVLVGLVQINLVLMIFNLIPLPPLDGFGIITQLFRLDEKSWYPRFYQLGPMFLLLIIVLGLTSYIISPGVNFVYYFLIGVFF